MKELLQFATGLLENGRAIDFAPLALSFVFALAMTFRRPKRSKAFIPLLLEGLVLIMAVIVVVSAVFPELYALLEKRGMYFQVLSMIVVIYAVRDIYSTLRGAGADSNQSNQ